ncbi:MAG: fibronectin type III-like domain-contianing protein, partial [Sphingopyxis sp.]
GLSYTSFSQSGLRMSGLTATFTVTNTGDREGATVAQLYMVTTPGGPQQRLAGFTKVVLRAGESRRVSVTVDPRIVAEWDNAGWTIAEGRYGFALGENAETLSAPVSVAMRARHWGP